MSREIDLSKPLTAEAVAELRTRHHESYVARMIELAGGVQQKAVETDGGASEAEEKSEEAPSATEDENGTEDAGEDLIGSPVELFDPSAHNAEAVVAHLKASDDAEKSRVLALEATGKARSTVLNA